MLARSTVFAALVLVSACAGVTPVGRSAERAPAPPVETQAAPQTAAPTPPAQNPPPAAAPQVVAPQAAPEQTAQQAERPAGDRDIVVRSGRETQVPPPAGDPRSMAQRMEDVRAWDQCVTAVQSAFDSDPMRPQLETPEDYCSRSLGMAERTAVPLSRRQR